MANRYLAGRKGTAGEVKLLKRGLMADGAGHWYGLDAAWQQELNDAQWKIVEPFIPQVPSRMDGKGRPRRDDREVLSAILWVLRSEARWHDLPPRFPPYNTCQRRFEQWVRSGVLQRVLEALAEDLRKRGKLDLSAGVRTSRLVAGKGDALPMAGPRGERMSSSWQWRTALVFLSPPTRRLLVRMRSPLSGQLASRVSRDASSAPGRRGSSRASN